MATENVEQLTVYHFEVDLGVPLEQEPVICSHDDQEAPYVPATFRYRRYLNRGILFEAQVYAFVCSSGCGMQYYLEEDSEKIDSALLERVYDLGLKDRPYDGKK